MPSVIKIDFCNQKSNLFLYKFPLMNEGERLESIWIDDNGEPFQLDLDLSQVEWENATEETTLRMCFFNMNLTIYAHY